MNWGYFIYRMIIDFILVGVILFAIYNIFLGIFWNSAWARKVVRSRLRGWGTTFTSSDINDPDFGVYPTLNECRGQGRDT